MAFGIHSFTHIFIQTEDAAMKMTSNFMTSQFLSRFALALLSSKVLRDRLNRIQDFDFVGFEPRGAFFVTNSLCMVKMILSTLAVLILLGPRPMDRTSTMTSTIPVWLRSGCGNFLARTGRS